MKTRKVKWYDWLNPFFYMQLIVLAYLGRALNNIHKNVSNTMSKEIRKRG